MAGIKRRKPIAAFALSLILPGLGQMYNGKLVRGATMLAAILLASVVLANSGFLSTFYGGCLAILLAWVLALSVALDAFLGARRVKDLPLKRYNRWYYYVGLYALFGLALNPFIVLTRPLYTLQVRTFKTPASSMEPILRKGDYFMTRVAPYRNQTPARNDVVVFPYPEDPSMVFVKRIVGLEGDKLEIRDKRLFVNDNPLEEPWAVHQDSASLPKDSSPRDYYGPAIIPQGAVFVLGDNRDKSLDSRFFGFVQWRKVVGKALYIYWSDDRKRIGLGVK